MNIRDLRELIGLSRPAFSEKYGVPVRTLEDWDSGRRNTPIAKEKALTEQVQEDIKNGVYDMSGEQKRAEIWAHVYVELLMAEKLLGSGMELALKYKEFELAPFTWYGNFTKKIMERFAEPVFPKVQECMGKISEYLSMFPTLEDAKNDTQLDQIWSFYETKFEGRKYEQHGN